MRPQSPQVSTGVYETAGRRGEDCMEDRHILTELGGKGRGALLAVFDGHRGPQAAEYARQHFEAELLRHWRGAGSAAGALAAAFLSVDAAFRAWHVGVTGELRIDGISCALHFVVEPSISTRPLPSMQSL